MKRLLHFSLLALTALLAAGAQVHAETIKWTYDWDAKTPAVFSDDGTGAVTFTNEPTKNATNGSYTVATNLKVISSADPDHLEHFNKHGAYTLTLTITDKDSGKSVTISFTARLGGTFGAGESNITSTTPLSTATPNRAMKPTPAEIENGRPRSQRARMPPVAAIGTLK